MPVSSADTATDNNNRNIHKSGRPTTLTTHDKYITYTYDSHGRVLYKTKTPLGKDGKALKQSGLGIVGYLESLQLAYNANHELTKSVTIIQQGLDLTEVTTTYQYDAFGRRISKHSQTKNKTRRANKQTAKIITFPVQKQKTQQSKVHYLWDGNRQLQEQTDTHVFTTIYEQDSFEPVARLVWLQDGIEIAANEPEYRSVWDDKPKPQSDIQIYHCHNDHLGTPNELTTHEGEVVWLADYEAWGNTAKIIWREEQLGHLQVSAEELQPIRFQGQSFDAETGLHYNRFRYFDPDLGMFTTRDPIGLMGGINVFQYAPNPVGWIDPFGLSRKQTTFTDSKGLTLDVHGYTDLSHYSDSDLKSLHYLNSPDNPRPFGKSPIDKKGNTIILHHYRQQTMGPIIAMPAGQHTSNSKALHPLGNKGGITNRSAFNDWKREFWHHQAEKELKKRGIKPACR